MLERSRQSSKLVAPATCDKPMSHVRIASTCDKKQKSNVARSDSRHLRHSAQKSVAGVTCDKNTKHGEQKISALCKKFGVSRATVYRHLKRGTLPAVHRRTGFDGKTYPAGKGRCSIGAVEKNLLLARQALARADRIACAQGLFADEMSLLQKISSEVFEILGRWRTVT